MNLYFETGGELKHHGIKGQKWGVRRYRNSDGSLTPAGKKRYSKEYRRLAIKAQDDVNRNYNRLYVEAHNKVADRMNKGGIDKFNAQQRKKYGEDYAKRDGYEEDYFKIFDDLMNKEFTKTYMNYLKSNENYIKAEKMVKEYNMAEWDDLARKNQEGYEAARKILES